MRVEQLFDILRLRLRSLFRRNAVEDEMDRELAFHIEQEIEQNLHRGLAPAEARTAALRRLGAVTQIQEECRDMRHTSWIENFVRDLRYAVRVLTKAPVFTATAAATLALGIGANAGMFHLLDAVRLRTLPVTEPNRLAHVEIPNLNFGISEDPRNLSYPLYLEISRNQQAFSGVLAWNSGYTSMRLGEGAETRPVSVMAVTGEFFATLGIAPSLGRLFRGEDDFRGCPANGVVVNHRFWQSQLGGNPIDGLRLLVQGVPLEVVGVTPSDFAGPEVGSRFDLAVPLCALSALRRGGDASLLERRDYAWLNVMGRLKPGWTFAQASEHLRAISPGLMRATLPAGYPPKPTDQYLQYRLAAVSGGTGVSRLREEYDQSLWLLLGLTGLVLLMACANLSNLMLARAGAREREFSVRLALGAGRGRLIGQTLAEGLLLAVVGATLGLGLSTFFSRAVIRFLKTAQVPVDLDLTPDWRIVAFLVAITCVTCVLLSLAPALQAARTRQMEAMKACGRGLTMDRSRFGFQRFLVVMQVSISLVLVVGAFLFAGSFRRLVTMDPGFRADGVLEARFDLGKQDQEEAVVRELLTQVRATPQVDSAAATTHFLIASGMWSLIVRTESLNRDARFAWVSPGFFETLGISLLAGRDISSSDTKSSPKVAVVNERFARLFFGGADPVGRVFRTAPEPGYPAAQYEVIGLVKNTRYQTLRAAEPPMVYIPSGQFPEGVVGTMLLIRSRAPLATVEAAIRRRVSGWRPGAGMEIQAFEQRISDSLMRERLLAALSSFFGVLAAVLASIGLWGVLGYQIVRRRSEIGIRLALGATRSRIIRLVLKEGALLVFTGLAIGLLGSLAVPQAAASLLFGVSVHDPLQLGAAAITLLTAAAAGSIFPALRASRVDAIEALREE